MKVTTATRPATQKRPNEDLVRKTDTAVVLLDGAGTPPGSASGCCHDVAWFVRQLGERMVCEMGYVDRSLPEALARSIHQTGMVHQDTCDLLHPGSPSSTVVAVRVLGTHLEFLVLADSTLVLDEESGLSVVTDGREGAVGRALRANMDAEPSGTARHTEEHRLYVEALRSYRNRDDGFWVASSDPAAADHALTGGVALEQLRKVMLLSDGASRLVDRFGLATWDEVLRLIDSRGPEALIDAVRAAELQDPLGRRWPRGKVHDDATVAFCRL